MILDKVFNTLKEHNRSLTKVDFTKHRRQDISNDSLCKLYVGLKQTAKQLKENGFTSYETNEKLADMVLVELENKVLEEI